MTTLYNQIVARFLEDLHKGGEIPVAQTERLRQLLLQDKRPKADDISKIFAEMPGGEVK